MKCVGVNRHAPRGSALTDWLAVVGSSVLLVAAVLVAFENCSMRKQFRSASAEERQEGRCETTDLERVRPLNHAAAQGVEADGFEGSTLGSPSTECLPKRLDASSLRSGMDIGFINAEFGGPDVISRGGCLSSVDVFVRRRFGSNLSNLLSVLVALTPAPLDHIVPEPEHVTLRSENVSILWAALHEMSTNDDPRAKDLSRMMDCLINFRSRSVGVLPPSGKDILADRVCSFREGRLMNQQLCRMANGIKTMLEPDSGDTSESQNAPAVFLAMDPLSLDLASWMRSLPNAVDWIESSGSIDTQARCMVESAIR